MTSVLGITFWADCCSDAHRIPFPLTQLMPGKSTTGWLGRVIELPSIWWPPTQKPLRIGERTFARGLGMRAPTPSLIGWDGRYMRFQAWGVWTRTLPKSPEAMWISRYSGTAKIFVWTAG